MPQRMIESNLDPWPVQALEATLGLTSNRAKERGELPILWHWLYFLPTAPRSSIGPDGQMVNEEWVDSSMRRRRLFAAARTDFLQPLKLGIKAQMTERVLARQDKNGKNGPFQVLTVEHQYFQSDTLCVREERDIVYIQGRVPAQAAPQDEFAAKSSAADPWVMSLTPDPVMLMRFSALTFNSHLIHFDQLYTQREEGYPERVVQGPLVAIVLAQLLRMNHMGRISRFEFRARSPLYVNRAVQLIGKPESDRVELRALGTSGALAMHATAFLVDGIKP
jgi:3-methylfumaryl-CoA hydratase